MFETIIVGIDGRPQDVEALALARQLAGSASRIVASTIFTVDASLSRTSSLVFDPEHLRAAKRTAEGFAAARDGVEGHGVSALSIGLGLQAEAKREGATLIVVASSHQGLFGRIFAGDVVHDVLRHAPCAVAIAPDGYAPAAGLKIGKVVVGHDGSAAAEAALSCVAQLRDRDDCEIEIVDVVEPSRAPLASIGRHERHSSIDDHVRARENIDVTSRRFKTLGEVTSGNVARELTRVASGADLLAVGLVGRDLVDRMLASGTAYMLLRAQTVPLLVVPSATSIERASGSRRRARQRARQNAA